jgi:hypothetical protein
LGEGSRACGTRWCAVGTDQAYDRETVEAVRAWLDGTPIRLLSP